MTGLTVTIITYNEEKNIGRCLDAIRGLTDEILVVDSFSTDNTVGICESYGCQIIQRKFTGFSDQKQFAVDQAKNDWILILDADEVVSDELKKEIALILHQDRIPFSGYEICFALFYMGRIMHHSGVGNEHKVRIFNRKYGAFEFAVVHEKLKMTGPVGRVKGKIIHNSYADLYHHVDKTNRYTSLAATINYDQGKKYSKLWVFFKFPISFMIYYFIKGGILDSYPGFMWSLLAAFSTTIKIAKTIEMKEKS